MRAALILLWAFAILIHIVFGSMNAIEGNFAKMLLNQSCLIILATALLVGLSEYGIKLGGEGGDV